jgi:hypothetical protein
MLRHILVVKILYFYGKQNVELQLKIAKRFSNSALLRHAKGKRALYSVFAKRQGRTEYILFCPIWSIWQSRVFVMKVRMYTRLQCAPYMRSSMYNEYYT